ncbi:DEAD/DEAH box helicase [Clostridium thermarum]|uniref:DEAD/DEAH box helicase n=1 Tax=Clostridium thermarum TaxID=1716543 RepID=UPI001122117D|nr:DEAD/DEAH box helicase [Clostridium thermarum]
MSNTFDTLGLNNALITALKKSGITEPTEIQSKVIPVALDNKDIIGQSKTGTGKTLAYLLPLFNKIDAAKREMQVIILAPTHELVIQIHKEIATLSQNSNLGVTSAAIIGNANLGRQLERLKEKPHIIVGSSGRILELIKMRKITAHTIKTIVIDEADRLLDATNLETVKAIIKSTLRDRQLMLFSATMPKKTVSIAQELMKSLEIIKVDEKDEVNPNIAHYYFVCDQRDKIVLLRKLVHAIKPERALVFINKSEDIERNTAKLKYHKLKAEGIHGSNAKEERKKALEDFRAGRINLLVASDIAARGLDIKGVTHVFNLEVPEDPKDYLHRVGRTGRAGSEGTALTIATEREIPLINNIRKTYKLSIQQKDIYMGKIIDKKNRRYHSDKNYK